MTMTLEQVRDRLRIVQRLARQVATRQDYREWADAIDAHIAGMGEPVAKSCADHVKGETGYCTFSVKVPWGTKLYLAPPIDLAAVREVIAHLRDTDETHLADKLEAAIQETSP